MDNQVEPVELHQVQGDFLGLILQREAHVEASHSPQAVACTKAKDLFSQRFPGVGQKYFTDLTNDLLDRIYPKSCPHCETPLSLGVKNRENAVRCPQCFFQGSRTAYTPLHHLKLPLWVFGFLFAEAMYRYPAVLSGSEIRRRLGVSSRTALLLKRRLQLFFSDLMPAVREEFKEELEKRFQNFDLPEEGEDVSAITAVRPVLNMDTVALFSASQRANGGRSRHRHTGQTASIYLSDKVAEEKGKYQIGTLCHTMAIKNGPVILDCIPDQKQRTIQPLLNFLPSQVPIFTDEGYPWLSKYNKNHRAVNHSARAKDKKRNVWGRNRWCKKGVHNQAAEGFQRNLKHSFIAGYSYVTPQFAPLYLNEYAGIKSLKHYGLDTIAARRLKMAGRGECDQGTLHPQVQGSRQRDDSYLKRKIGCFKYLLPTLTDARSLSHTSSRKQIRMGLRELLDREDYFEARQAHLDYLHFWDDAALYRKQLEKKYGAVAHQLWNKLHRWDPKALHPIAEEIKAPHRLLLRIVRRWKKLNLARVEEYRGSTRHLHCYATRMTSVLPDLLYSFNLDEFMNQQVKKPGQKHPDSVPSTTLSGMDKAKRKQNLEEIQTWQRRETRHSGSSRSTSGN